MDQKSYTAQLFAYYPRNRRYYTDGTGLTGLAWKGQIVWWRWTPTGYKVTGSTRNPGGKRDFVSVHRIPGR